MAWFGPSRMVRYWMVRGVAVLETAVLESLTGEIPAPADRLDGFERAEGPLREPVERVAAAVAGGDGRQFLDLEIFGKAFELHRDGSIILRGVLSGPCRHQPAYHSACRNRTRAA